MLNRILFVLLSLMLNQALAQSSKDITGAGASLPYPAYASIAAKYYQTTGNRVNYQSMGSGGGQQQIIANTVDFGATDDPMQDAAENQLLQFPAIIGGIVPVINIDGINPSDLKLSATVLADIFLGNIENWNDIAISELNPELNLPDEPIVVIHRADGSGTTYAWSNYLAQVSQQWQTEVGVGKAVKWPVGQGAKGNEGVAAYVGQLENTIGYVEYAYAKQNGLAWVQLKNNDGYFVEPSPLGFMAAAASINWENFDSRYQLNNEAGTDTWPIAVFSYILVPESTNKPRKTRAVLDFFDWYFDEGDDVLHELGYVTLPDIAADKIRNDWENQIKTVDGSQLWQRDMDK